MLTPYQKQFFFTLLLAGLMASMVACSDAPDIDYIITADEGTDPDAALAACEAQRFVTLDCIELLAESAEAEIENQAAVTTANQDLNDVLDCYTYEITVAEEADEVVDEEEVETTTTSSSCEDVATNLLAGFDVCVSMEEDLKYYECKDIEEAVNTAVSLCDASSVDISVDFCSLINPTTDTD